MCVQKNTFHFCKNCKVPLYRYDKKEIKRCSIAVISCDERCGFVDHEDTPVYENLCSDCDSQPDTDPYASPKRPDRKKKRVSWIDEQQGGNLATITEVPSNLGLSAQEKDQPDIYLMEKLSLI